MSKAEAKEFAVAVARVFVFAAAPAFVALVQGAGPVDSVATAKAVAYAVVAGAVVAGVRAVYGAFRSGQLPFPEKGV